MVPLLLTLFFLCLFTDASCALVLCAASGGVINQVNEGATVVVRTSCQINETTLGPVTFPGLDLTETAARDKTTVVTRDMATTVGRNRADVIGGDDAQVIGGKRSQVIGGQSETQIETNQIEEAGLDRTEQVGRNELEVIGGNLTTQVSGNTQQVTAKDQTINAKKISLTAADQLVLKTGRAMIMMKKNGDITISGVNVNIKGSNTASIKGSKVADN